jgi:hypothetical protein
MIQDVQPGWPAAAGNEQEHEPFARSHRHTPAPPAGYPAPDRNAVKSCWLCGIRLPAGDMMADGDSTRLDVRWYCLDTRGCTERWTQRAARPAGRREAPAGPDGHPGPASGPGRLTPGRHGPAHQAAPEPVPGHPGQPRRACGGPRPGVMRPAAVGVLAGQPAAATPG